MNRSECGMGEIWGGVLKIDSEIFLLKKDLRILMSFLFIDFHFP